MKALIMKFSIFNDGIIIIVFFYLETLTRLHKTDYALFEVDFENILRN